MKFYKYLLATVFAALSYMPQAGADTPTYSDPYKMMEVLADNTFSRIARQQQDIAADPEVLRVIVNEELVPYIDSRYAALRVIGTSADLRKTPREDILAFVDAFQNYMVATYAGVFTQYRDQKVIIEPALGGIEEQKIIVVKTRVIDPGKPDINIDFKLRRAKDSESWQVFDMVAEGISLLDSKRAELGNLIRQQGLNSVTLLLQEKAKAPITKAEAK
ncbi:MlaC/ttg2D family ABC transporter substrate-binding protein [Rheinheimera baltica]|uniref:ABC transporter substrate-binding protein n=1 Tax=Rheinheimera baltica TaxID=67576 RepID=A0ABT9HZU2_9GAMM|nr:ABC transporter substrate-binding protein [Rheinheimera baltica]MDP5136655.1 ABC transporter substrate-binding protein [Rheinheimera baltica]MDP5142489.1 ABC transporter substrate-binding protein [Rheinheimera baltica]MDP5188661.1 ABC transporter substrate-binding protein [Rheinheimera baltica]